MENSEAIRILRSIQEPEAWEQPVKGEVFEALEIGIKAIEESKDMVNAKKIMKLIMDTNDELCKGAEGSPGAGMTKAIAGIMACKVGLALQGKI